LQLAASPTAVGDDDDEDKSQTRITVLRTISMTTIGTILLRTFVLKQAVICFPIATRICCHFLEVQSSGILHLQMSTK
jgi:hypothetical protein